MKFSDFRNLDYQNIGSWPNGVKTVASIFVVVLILFAGWYFKIRDQQEAIEGLQVREEQFKKEFEDKQKKVVNLDALKEQLEEMKDRLRQLLRQLPSKTEMPELLLNVSQTALSSGIVNELFQPGPEAIKEFYAEKPITLRMVGSYHQFGNFISGVASLPRVVILTMHDVSLKPGAKSDPKAGALPPGTLVLEGTVKTYRYVEEDEMAENAGAQPGKPGAPGTPAPNKVPPAAPAGGK
jgi:type IV pilus assembly protein PilO